MIVSKDVLSELGKMILGKSQAIELLWAAILAKGHVLIEDVPGTGKTSLARGIAKILGADFKRVQFTPDMLPSDVIGGPIWLPSKEEFSMKWGPIFTQFLLADEINRASPRTQSALLEAMEEGQVSIDGVSYPLKEPFVVMATQNPVEFQGVFHLPEAQMDRFLISMEIGYPDELVESEILLAGKKRDLDVQTLFNSEELIAAQLQVAQIHIHDDLKRYIVQLVAKTRQHPDIRLGASPRVSMGMASLSQAFAWMDGRDHVTPIDVQKTIVPVMAHRIYLKEELQGVSKRKWVEQLMQSTQVPI